MATFTTVIHVVTCVLIVLVVLMQSGKGAEISSNLGGSSQTIFGNSGGNFFTKLTFGLAAVFMVTSVILTMMGSQSKKSIFEGQVPPTTETTTPNPVAPEPNAAAK
jgi:preprotein translocase subunit SecG